MLEFWLSLIIFLFPLAYSPGPGNLFFAAHSARFGLRASAASLFGYHLATWIAAAFIGLGFAGAAGLFPQGFALIKFVAGFYIIWLAYKLSLAGSSAQSESIQHQARFWEGALLLLFNPKGYLIMSLMFTQFLEGEDGAFKIFMITSIFTLNNLVAFLIWAWLGDVIGQAFRAQKSAILLNRVFASLLFATAIWLMFF